MVFWLAAKVAISHAFFLMFYPAIVAYTSSPVPTHSVDVLTRPRDSGRTEVPRNDYVDVSVKFASDILPASIAHDLGVALDEEVPGVSLEVPVRIPDSFPDARRYGLGDGELLSDSNGTFANISKIAGHGRSSPTQSTWHSMVQPQPGPWSAFASVVTGGAALGLYGVGL